MLQRRHTIIRSMGKITISALLSMCIASAGQAAGRPITANDLLSMERSLEPLFHFVTREIREDQLSRGLFGERHSAMRTTILARMRTVYDADHDMIRVQLTDQMFERLP